MLTQRTHLGALLRGLRYGQQSTILQSDVAKALNVTDRTVRNWERTGRIPARRLGQLLNLYDASAEQRSAALTAAARDAEPHL